MGTYARILCPIDFSGYAKAALREAIALAQSMGSELSLLHAHQSPEYVMPMAGYLDITPEMRTKLQQQLVAELEALAAEPRKLGLRVQTHVVEGLPYKSIVEHAEAWKADLIVMGTHGRTGLAHALTGSVAERVVRTAHCPVLITRGQL